MKTKNENQEQVFPVVVTGKRATVVGKSIAGVKFTPDLIEKIETKKDQPDWQYCQFWVGQSGLRSLLRWKKPGRKFLMCKFYLADRTSKSMYVKSAWLKGQALTYIASYWQQEAK